MAVTYNEKGLADQVSAIGFTNRQDRHIDNNITGTDPEDQFVGQDRNTRK